MAKATYAKNFRFIRAFCVLIKKERMRLECRILSFYLLLLYVFQYVIYYWLRRLVASVENLLLQNLVTFDSVDVCHVAS